MKKFMILTFGFEMPTPEVMEPWNQWFKQLDEYTVEIGSPFGPGIEIAKDGTSKNLSMDKDSITGFRVIQAENIEQAKEITKGCPSMSGMRIYELINMQ